MVRLEKISKSNYYECAKLNVAEEQRKFVANNIWSLAQAYIMSLSDKNISIPYAVYSNETMVGFIMIEYIEEKGEMIYEIGRMMIAKDYQGKGYGRGAMEQAIEIIKTLPHGPANKILLSYVPGNDVAKKLYNSLGFAENGEIEHGEIVAVLEI